MEKQNLLNPPVSFEIPMSFYKNHRQILVQNIKNELKTTPGSVIFFKGVPSIPQDDQDIDHDVVQEDTFQYYFGVEEADCFGLIEIDSGKTTLFPFKFHEDYKIWMTILSKEDYQKKYEVDQTFYSDEIEKILDELKPSTIYIYDGINSDSGLRPYQLDYKYLNKFNVNKDDLYEIVNEQRVIKDETEIKVMEFITKISSDAHIKVMREVKPKLKEFQMAALFKFYVNERCGPIFKAYNCICASGECNAILHYIDNLGDIGESCLILNDMGAKYKGYCSDITCSFPSNGKFTKHQADIYNAVLDSNIQVQKELKVGVKWEDMHLLAERVILQHLIKLQIVNDFPMEELVQKRIGAIFFPHGLGHLLGGRVHDVGGYSKKTPQRHTEAGLKSLRTRRTIEENMVITIEPGLYFMKEKLQRAFQDPEVAKYLNLEKIEEYRHVGGVRIEDDVYVTKKDGCVNMTVVPRTVEEIERCMAGLEWRN